MKKRTHEVVYCVDIDARRVEVMEFSGEELEIDLDAFGVSDASELQDDDRRIFKNERDAELFVEAFNEVKNNLRTLASSPLRGIPSLLLKKRYLIMILLGEKTYTTRDYNRAWPPGTIFNLHDQTHFISVRLREIKDNKDGTFTYHFKPLSN